MADICVWPIGDELLVFTDADFVREEAAECSVAAVTNVAAQRYQTAADHERGRVTYFARD